MAEKARRMTSRMLVPLLFTVCLASTATATFVEFSNCLDPSIVNSNPPNQLLQFVPLNVSASFDTSPGKNRLEVTVYGNVTGQATVGSYPPPSSPRWSDPSDTFGKIPDLSVSNNKYTTLFARYNVLSYTPYSAPAARFCQATVDGDHCPLGPAFYENSTDLRALPAYSIAHDMYSTYAFTSITANMRIQSGDASGQYYGCINAIITPDLGTTLNGLLRYLPLAILIVVGIATIMAAMLSPWGSSDIFHWSSNFGRDEDLLRLVTPGFSDCLQYLQFIVFTGSLSLGYPGFYQPVVSRVGWSSLMFNESFVTGGDGRSGIVDGIYSVGTSSDYGLDRMGRLVGMSSSRNIWVGMIIWLVVIVAAVFVLIQLGFLARWVYRQVAHVPAEDLRSKNGPFTAGNMIRVCLNYFLLPLVALSFYQLVIAGRGPSYAVALAAICLVAVILFCARLLFLFIKTQPRQYLFDDLFTLLAYGPLYNTYCDNTATFALLPIFITFLRGLAIGAVQPSGIAQIVLLGICEIILICNITAFRPYPSATSMNIYHTCFGIIRLITIFLLIAFVPSLNVTESSRGWVGYAILLVHACVLVFGFFLNAVQTLVEVIARLAGAGGRDNVDGGAARGGLTKVFGMRQLSRRTPRGDAASRNSMASGAAMLQRMDTEQKEMQMAKPRSRSISASSTMLLDNARNPNRLSQNLDGMSGGQTTPDAASTFSKRMTDRFSGQSVGGILGLSNVETKDPYYRPPRRNTMEPMSASDKQSGEWPRAGVSGGNEHAVEDDPGEGTSTPARIDKDDAEEANIEGRQGSKDYAVREVDFYYGVRGPALSSGTRKLKTGPADPTGPTSIATGWFRNLIGGKTKEKHKGFEVVRSSRAPPPGLFPPMPETDRQPIEAYHDEPQSPENARRDRARPLHTSTPVQRDRESISDEDDIAAESDDEDFQPSNIPARPPSLPLIDSVGAIEMPSRIGSEASRKSRKRGKQRAEENAPDVPALPRKSSRRTSSHDYADTFKSKLSPVQGSPVQQRNSTATMTSNRLPFTDTQASGFRLNTNLANTNRNSIGADSAISDYTHDQENEPPHDGQDTPTSYTQRLRQSSGALGYHAVGDRPSSIGIVQQHRASDNIHYSPDGEEMSGVVAEVRGSSRNRR